MGGAATPLLSSMTMLPNRHVRRNGSACQMLDRWRMQMETAGGRVTRSDPYLDPDDGGYRMEFRLTYAGKLLSHRDDGKLPQRSLHVHDIRREFQKQLRMVWAEHPALKARLDNWKQHNKLDEQIFTAEGFHWFPMVTERNYLVCALNILMLRPGPPAQVVHDVDNRLKTIFDALRKAKGPLELGLNTPSGKQVPSLDEDPFYVLLENDNLITHVSVTSDMLLEPIKNVSDDTAVRLVIDVVIRPYFTELYNMEFA